MKIEPKVKLGLYLDLLPMDFNQGVYQTVSGVSQDSYEFNKYS